MVTLEIRAVRNHVRRTSTARRIATGGRRSLGPAEHVSRLRHWCPCERVRLQTLGQHNKKLRVPDLQQVGEERA